MKTGARILVVEDDDDVRSLVARVLADDGHQVETASDGDVAIEKMHARPTDLLVLDVVLPGLDGWDVLAHVRRMEKAPRVLLLTGNSEYQTFIRAAREGVSAYIEKPFSLRELLATCRSVLESTPPTRDGLAADRRTAPRHLLRVPLEVLLEEGAWRTRGKMLDLSTGGVRLSVGTPLPAREALRLAFTPPGTKAVLDLEGRVQWRVPLDRGFSYGVSFVNMAPAMQECLQLVLEHQA